MSKEQIKTNRFSGRFWLTLLVILAVVPGTLLLSWKMGGRKYYVSSVLLILYAMVPFFLSFEKRKPQAREVVTLAVMCAIAVASRAAFIMLPHFKPMTGIIIISGIAFGSEAGFLTGAVSGFVSNFIFGQGAWTPWQMFAFGMAGFLAGILAKKGIIGRDRRAATAVFGGLAVLLVVGPLLDTCTLFTMSTMVSAESVGSIYLSGLPVNLVHAAATVLTLWLLCRPMLEKLDRIRVKYGMMGDEDEI